MGNSLAWNGTRMVAVGMSGWRSATSATLWLTGGLVFYNDVAWDGHNFVAVGDAIIGISADGVTWTTGTANASAPNLSAVAGSGTDWVAVGTAGSLLHASAAAPSTWTASSSPTSMDLHAVTWTGNQFVAVGKAGTVVTSPNGTTWSLQPAAGTADLNSVAAGSASSIVALAATTPTTTLLSSANATSWTLAYTSTSTLNRVTYQHGTYVALGNNTSATSTNGTTWNTGGSVAALLFASIYDGSRFVAIGEGVSGDPAVFGSPDGLSWTPLIIEMGLASIAQSPADGRLVLANGGHSAYVQSSLDSIAWEYGSLPDYTFIDAVWAPSLNGFAALVGYGATLYLYQSTDGVTWTRIGIAPCANSLAASSTAIVAVGPSGLGGSCFESTTSGTTWTTHTPPGNAVYNKVHWTGAQFLAVGSAGALASSTDGATWTALSSGPRGNLNGAASSGSTLVVVGDTGTALRSTDSGQTWVVRSSGTTASLQSVIWTGKEFVAVGSGATLLRSPDGATWTTEATPYSPGVFTYTLDFSAVSWSASTSLLTVVGSSGFVATVP
jgi:hypothetical protein